MQKTVFLLALGGVALLGTTGLAISHCEIPCGIYNDTLRVVMIREDIATVEKSMKAIRDLGAAEKPHWNQLVRWVRNKEEHAGKIQEIVTRYFLTQRIKVPAEGDREAREKYVRRLVALHQLLVTAMKMKQSTDPAVCRTARSLLDEFSRAYFSAEDRAHLGTHRGN